LKITGSGQPKHVKKDKPYKQTLTWYSDTYGIPFQTIRNAQKRGWPLDNPAELLRHMMASKGKKTNLQGLINIVNGQQGPSKKSPGSSRNDQNPPPYTPPGQTESEDVAHDLLSGLQAELKRLEAETAQSYANYQAEKLPADKLVKQKLYLANVNALRALAKDAPKADRDAKNSLPIADVESAWSRSVKEFRSECEGMPRRFATNPLFKKLDPVDVEELAMKEVQQILSHLETGAWFQNETPAP
jgi:hypothetical protein